MIIVVDTSVLIDHLRGDDRAHRALAGAATGNHRLVSSVATKVEVLAGMRTSEERSTRRLLDAIGWIPVDDRVAERAGALANTYRSHPGVDPIDYIIAAMVQGLGAILWTRNVEHFPMFADLASPY